MDMPSSPRPHRAFTGASPGLGYTRLASKEVAKPTMFGESFWIYVLVVMLPSIAITGWAAWRVRSTYARWSKVDSGIHLSAFDFARQLLDRQGLRDVSIE